MPAIGPLDLSRLGADKPQIGFVNECRGIQRLPGLFLGQLGGR
jgi:hypothetical protein